jgi:hypothetical protein
MLVVNGKHMGKTYKRNDRWKRDRRDQNFKKSKKFKEFKHGGFPTPKPNLPTTDSEPIEITDDAIVS